MSMKFPKTLLLISFLIIIFPSKIILPNGLVILYGLTLNSSLFFNDSFNFNSLLNFLMFVIALMGTVMTMLKKPKLNILGMIFQYIWLGYMFKLKFLNYWYFTIPTAVYVILSLILIYKLFFRNKKETNN